jgi:hypothetical protein
MRQRPAEFPSVELPDEMAPGSARRERGDRVASCSLEGGKGQ